MKRTTHVNINDIKEQELKLQKFYNVSNFLNETVAHRFKENMNFVDRNEETYKDFLNHIVPKTKSIIEIMKNTITKYFIKSFIFK